MALFNYATKEITLKIVYYGPGISGKTTNLQKLHSVLDPQKTGRLLTLATETDRTLFFDFLPVELGKIKDFSIRFQLYTVPGQVKYNATRKIVLKGADAVVFVADSQIEMRKANMESLVNMRENLLSNNINPDNIPLILQYNKRDLPDILSITELNKDLNNTDQVYLKAEAINGKGVEETFQTITKLLIKDIARKHKFEIQPPVPFVEIDSQPKESLPIITETEPIVEEVLMKEPEPPIISSQKPVVEEVPMEEPPLEEEMIFPSSFFQESITKTEEEKTPAIPVEKPITKEEKDTEKLDKMAEGLKEINQLLINIIEKEQEKDREKPEIKEVPVFPVEKLDRITEDLKETYQLLIAIKAAIKEFSDELKRSREYQKETLDIIREVKISETLERLKSKEKEKKRWFRLKKS